METLSKTLTGTFQLIGTGPLFITLEGGKTAQFHATDSVTPPAADAPIHSMHVNSKSVEDRTWWNYPGSLKLYAKMPDSPGALVTKISYTGV